MVLVAWAGLHGTSAYNQDTIIFSNADRLVASIILIDDSTVTFKKYRNLDGPVYKKRLTDVSKIRYKNGDVETYNGQAVVANAEYEAIASTDPTSLTKRGNRVYVEIPDESSRAGEKYFINALNEWGYWTIVTDPREAHFVIVFNIDKKAMLDKSAIVILKTRDGKEFMRSRSFRSSTSAFDGYNAFRAVAQKVVRKYFEVEFK